MLENLILLLIALALFLHLTQSYFNRAMIWDIEDVSGKITRIVDSLISISDDSSGPTCITACNELGFLNDTYQVIHLRQYLIARFHSRAAGMLFKNDYIKNRRGLVRFSVKGNRDVRNAILGMLIIQAKLSALANYPDIASQYRDELIKCSQLIPQNALDLVNTLDLLHEICNRYEIDYDVYTDHKPEVLLGILKRQLTFASTERRSKMISVVNNYYPSD